jgi:mono/diheme cytochrome c family protein
MQTHLQVALTIILAMVFGEMVWADGLRGNAENGERVYRINCLNCHGATGRGDGPVAESLTPRPADFTTETVQNKQEKELLKIIREGKPGTSMPSRQGELSDQHIHDVLVYLRGFGGKTWKAGG